MKHKILMSGKGQKQGNNNPDDGLGSKILTYLLFFSIIILSENSFAQNDLPNPTANPMNIKQGSLVIGMDNTTQALPGYFNLKSYGLANKLLQAGIPIKWAIKAGKGKDGIDFTATAQREYPSALSATTYNFKSGPFIIDSANAQAARSIITSFGGSVAVYRLTQNITVDIRYTLNFKPRIAVFNNGNNSKIHLGYLKEAGIDTPTYVTIIPELTPLNPCQNNGGFSFASEGHWDDHTDTAVSHSVYRFVRGGGNFLAECAAIELYENDDTLHTTTGLDKTNNGYSTFSYPNADMAIAQIDGPLADIGGSLHNWYKKSTGSFRSGHYCVAGAPTGTQYQTVSGAKCIASNLSGGNMFYLGGHSYGNGTHNDEINGRRMYLNAAFVPPGAAAYCNLQPIAVNFNAVQIKCKGNNNGSVNVNINGGVPPYRYAWTNGDTSRILSNMAPGNYTINITDNIGQTSSSTVTITEPTALTSTRTVSNYNGYNVSCFGSTNGFISLSGSGGVTAYSYSWSNGAITPIISNIGTGTYSYTITDANGCKLNGSVTLNSPTPLSTTKNVSDYNGSGVSCKNSSNGFINIIPSGGVSGYTYVWTPGGNTTQNRTNLAAGNYTCKITDSNGCTVSNTATITSPTLLTSPYSTSNYNGRNVSCAGSNDGWINMNPSGGISPYSYVWFPGGFTTRNLTNAAAGSYSCIITDANGCTTTSSIALDSPSPLSAPKTISDYNGTNVTCKGSTDGSINLSVTGGTGPYAYQWSNGNTASNISNLGAGTYSYNITDINGCAVAGSAVISEPQAVATLKTVTDYNGFGTSCAGTSDGSISLNVNGGVQPYTYSWSNSVTDVPHPDHVVVLILENHGYGQVVGSPAAPYLNNLINDNKTALFTQSYGLSHPSQPNYIHLFSGSNQGVTNNYLPGALPFTAPNLGNELITASKTFIGFCESLPYAGYDGEVSGAYMRKHNPWVNWQDSPINGIPSSSNQPFTAFPSNYTLLPDVSFIVPDLNNDMHDGIDPDRITASDTWIQNNLDGYVQWAKTNNSLLIITFDEDDGASMQNIMTTMTGSMVKHGNYSNHIDHYNVLRLIEDMFSLPHAGAAGSALPVNYCWENQNRSSVNNLSAGKYSYMVADANGCQSSDSITISSPPVLTAPYAVSVYNGINVSCNGSSNGYIDVTAGGGTQPYTYSWSTGDTGSRLDSITSGTYSFMVTDVNGCNVSKSVTLNTSNSLMVPNTVSDYNGFGVSCNGSSNGFIDLSIAGGTAPYQFAWSPGGMSTQDLSNIGAGAYTYVVTDANGCTNSGTIVMNAPTPLSAPESISNFNGTSLSCSGASDGYINLAVTGGTAPYNISWLPGNMSGPVVSDLPAGTYTYTVTDMNGCIVSNSDTLNEPPPLIMPRVISDFNGNGVSCFGSSNGFIHLNVSGGTLPYQYSWPSNNNTTANLDNISAGQYSVNVTDANGCIISDFIAIAQPPALNGSIQTSDYNGYGISCAGGNNGSADLSVNGGTAPYTYVWSTSTGSAQDIQNLTTGSYTVIITDNNGCVHVDSVRITEPAALIMSGTVTDAKCNRSADGAINIQVQGGVSAYTYHWSNGSTSNTNLNLSAGQFAITVNDMNGCELNNIYTVSEPAPISLQIASPNLNGANQVSCFGFADGTAQANTSGGTNPYSYAWSTGSTAAGISGLSAGNYSVIVSDNHSCTITSSITLTEPGKIVAAAGSFASICGNNSSMNAMMVANGLTGTWIIQSGNGTFSDAHNPMSDINNMTYGTNTFRWIVTDGICVSADSVSIQSFEPVNADAGADDKICQKMINGYLLKAAQPVVGTGYWSTSGIARVSDIYNPITEVSSLGDGSNDFVWTVTNGVCSASDAVEIYLKSKVDCYENLEMPTAFSPNGDGSNDDFDIHGIEKYPDNSFEVFNRWGNLVYKADNYINHQWTGLNKSGEELPDGTYFVILEIKNSDLRLHGYVDIRK